jgi:hypothetical protein
MGKKIKYGTIDILDSEFDEDKMMISIKLYNRRKSEVEELKKENSALKAELQKRTCCPGCPDCLSSGSKAEIKRLRGALEWYANPCGPCAETYKGTCHASPDRARQALNYTPTGIKPSGSNETIPEQVSSRSGILSKESRETGPSLTAREEENKK